MLLFLFTLLSVSHACVDSVQTCVKLAELGYCDTNQLVREKCPKSCELCEESTTPEPTAEPTERGEDVDLNDGMGGEKGVDGCYGTNKDCQDEVLVCTNEFTRDGVEMTFTNLKLCIYEKVAAGDATECCNTYVTVGQQLDPDYETIRDGGERVVRPTPGPGQTPSPVVGDMTLCPKTFNSKDCLDNDACQWDYWTRVCRAINFNRQECNDDTRDCKDELNMCIESEKSQGREPELRNLEPCVLMNAQSDCCKLYTDTYLTLIGPKRDNRPDRFDKANCELYTRNSACKNQSHCRWVREKKICEPMPGIEAPGLWYVPEMSCGYKSFKLVFENKIQVTKRNVKTTCECALFCDEYEHWVYRQSSSKCGCTNQPVKKVARGKKGWWGSSTKSANKRDLN